MFSLLSLGLQIDSKGEQIIMKPLCWAILLVIAFGTPSALAANKVLSLDGDRDYMLIGKKDAFNTTTLTMEVWFNIRESDGWTTLLWNGDTTGGRDPFWLYTPVGCDAPFFSLIASVYIPTSSNRQSQLYINIFRLLFTIPTYSTFFNLFILR